MAGSNSGMQNNNIGLAPLVNCPVCPVHYVTELQMRPGSARRGQRSLVGPGRILRLSGRVSLDQAGQCFRLDPQKWCVRGHVTSFIFGKWKHVQYIES